MYRQIAPLDPDHVVQYEWLNSRGAIARFDRNAIEIRVIDTPGHTGDSVSYLVDGSVFVGDTLFAPGYGTARCDFPGGGWK